MKVLSFTLTEELLAVGEFCAIASPAKLKDATARARMQILEIVVSVFFITFPVDARRSTPTIKNRKFASFWTSQIPISASGICLPCRKLSDEGGTPGPIRLGRRSVGR